MSCPTDHSGLPVVLRWNRHASSAGLARWELCKILSDWGLSALEEPALLVLSELVTNAVRHARVSPGREIETHFLPASGGLRLEVHDASSEQPRQRVPELDECGGRGLMLVEALAEQWGVSDRDGVGKVVWALLSAPSASGGVPHAE
ncbi:ATP-binding protein [Streptomyces sp. NPDC088124]|uniref:ATP-binding protein n=1 Tax=Streptomyces sp. NPDC088124 TaxID=3154654 RepID=UPI00342869DA